MRFGFEIKHRPLCWLWMLYSQTLNTTFSIFGRLQQYSHLRRSNIPLSQSWITVIIFNKPINRQVNVLQRLCSTTLKWTASQDCTATLETSHSLATHFIRPKIVTLNNKNETQYSRFLQVFILKCNIKR